MIIELKAVSRLLPLHRAQVISYLKGFEKPLGILANCGGKSLEHAIYPNKTDQKTPLADHFDFEKIRLKGKDDIKDLLVMANRILVTLGAGYFHQIYRRAFYWELKRSGSAFIHPNRPSIPRCKSESSVLIWFKRENETTPAFQSKEGVENADGILNQKQDNSRA